MVGCPRIGFRLVSLVAAAATLLAAWLPPGRACACGPAAATVDPVSVPGPSPCACPCCGQRPAPDEAPRACCLAHAKAETPGAAQCCGCVPQNGPASREPAAPPRPANPDDGPVLLAAGVAPADVNFSAIIGPTAAEWSICWAVPRPTDLVVSLSRFTC